MTIWNVVLPVVANVEAADAGAAIAALWEALDRAGFAPEPLAAEYGAPFEAEAGTEADELPTGLCRCHTPTLAFTPAAPNGTAATPNRSDR